MNYYRHYIGDYQRDTRHLSLAEEGVYRRMLDHYYATEKPLPSDLASLCRLVGCQTKAERLAVGKIMDEFWPEGGGGRVNPRAKRELIESQKRREVARTNGKHHEGKPKDPPANPSGIPPGTQPVIQHDPSGATSQPPVANSHNSKEILDGVSRSLRAQKPRVDYSDPANRTARWMQKMTDYVNRALPAEQASKLIVARMNEEPWAITEFNRLDKERKAKEARV